MEAANSDEEDNKRNKAMKKNTPEGGGELKITKQRTMKTPSQLQLLEKTYAVDQYPSESLRAEMSVQLGLTDRQLQMWFCHRRLKDRKPQPTPKRLPKESPAPVSTPVQAQELAVGGGGEPGEVGNEQHYSASSQYSQGRVVPRSGVAVPRISGDSRKAVRRHHNTTQTTAELRAMAYVEAQLGEPLRVDGPILGMEFDHLPPDAFGASIGMAMMGQHKQIWRSFEANVYERPVAKAIKGPSRAVHEYQFLPEQPTVRTEAYERAAQSYQYGSPAEGSNARSSPLSAEHRLMQGNEQVSSGYGFPGQVSSLRPSHLLPSVSRERDDVLRKHSFTNIATEAPFVAHPITAMDNPFASPDMMVANDEDAVQIERKRKSEETRRIAREVEAHEKRIRKELEKQDILRRKREEQMRKEMERQERERRKEEERILREKQREEERYLRDQRREMERQEKFLQKESIKVERMRQKEELRRIKEAARLKAANERAIARRIAKESIDLVEDERLELMELAASSKGLPSILSLDFETVQNLDVFRGGMTTSDDCMGLMQSDKSVFPPKSVKLKRPFSVQPWKSSDETVGNLLMVWRFLITFADVLGLWPFTLDEYVQAFHDYDPRLLGEIHVSLLRSIIKDIVNVARTPSPGLGTNQSNAASPPGGGHPHIIEGACAWGFDICSWQRHLNAQTWPEILRQFGLSAGFGPQLKKKNIEQTYLCDENEGNNGVEIVSNLRNGVAAGNAFAIMRDRGYSNPPRSRHRLTPGTVKFAAFHVLSLEGSNGIAILELVEKIQKSGLRDLTTSKTPEASISAALSRDTKLFERTAPSTYCVRSPYRKDPADAEAILQATKERVRIFKSGLVDGEDADDVDREEESDSDIAEDPDVDELGTELNPKRESRGFQEAIDLSAKTLMENGKCQVMETPQIRIGNANEDFVSVQHDSSNGLEHVDTSVDQSVGFSGICNETDNIDLKNTIDERNPGEPWVQGLMEGDYSDLSVEERLNALVALVGVAIEGKSIHLVLEERLEAANALKKQMWAEAQLDKRRMKEEFVTRMYNPSSLGDRTEPNLTVSKAEGSQSPFVAVENRSKETSADPAAQPEHLSELQNGQIYTNDFPSESNLRLQAFATGPDSIQYQQQVYIAEKSRSRLKSYIGHKAEEMYVYRSLPLGQDRRRTRYWQFITSPSCNDPGRGRIFVELHNGRWRLIDTEEDFDALLASLDVRGIRESHLHMMLQKIEKSFKETVRRNILSADTERKIGDIKSQTLKMEAGSDCNLSTDSPRSTVCAMDSDMCETSTSIAIEVGKTETEKKNALKTYRDFEKWMWKECLGSSTLCAEKYGRKRAVQLLYICNSCHEVYSLRDWECPSCQRICGLSETKFGFFEHLAQRGENYEVDHGPDFCDSIACPLRISLVKVQLALIEVSIPPEALQTIWSDDYRISWGLKLLSSKSCEELLQMLTILESALRRDFLSSNFETTNELLGLSSQSGHSGYTSSPDIVPVLPWVPKTSSAVVLRLMEFDKSICYTLQQKAEFEKDNRADEFLRVPAKYAVPSNTQDYHGAETQHHIEYIGANWNDAGNISVGSARGRGARGCPRGKSQKKVRSGAGKRSSAVNNENLGQSRGRGGRKRGRRSTKKRQKPTKKVGNNIGSSNSPKHIIFKEPGQGLARDEWDGFETTIPEADPAEVPSSSERSEYDDENGQTTRYEYGDQAADGDDYAIGFNGKPEELINESDYIMDSREEDDDYEIEEDGDDVAGSEQDDMYIEEYINRDSDEVMGSTSSEFSD